MRSLNTATKTKIAPLLMVALVALLSWEAGWAQTSRSKGRAGPNSAAKPTTETPGKNSPKPVVVDIPPQLREGEKLDYTANFSKLSNVAAIRLAIAERRDFYGRSAWHLQATAHTINPMRILYELDDQFDSYSDAATLAGLQYEMHISERGQKQNAALRLMPPGSPVPSNATAAYVPPGTRDPLGFVAYLRTVDWQRTKDVTATVYDGRNLYELRAHLASDSVNITVPAGNYAASRIEVHVFQNSAELKDTRFALSLAHNAARTPVLLEAEVPLGTARVELTYAQ